MGIPRVKLRLRKLRVWQVAKRISQRFSTTTKSAVLFVDRNIHKMLTLLLRRLYRIKSLRTISKKLYRFTQLHHRLTSLAVVAVLVLSVAAPVLQIIAYNRQYSLSEQARTLLGESNSKLTKKITYDEKAQLYQFNKEAKVGSPAEGNPLAKLQSQVGGEGEDDEQQHSIDIPRDFSKGVTYYDNKKELSFKLIPEFTAKRGGLKEGHLIYPLTDIRGQVAYTVTNSGLKENIILYESPGKTFKTSYSLELPKSLEARMIAETGEIGIYSADPSLFGNISYGSSDDQARVENARNNSEKTYLSFKIPAPVVMGLNGNDQSTVAPVKSSFSLQNSTLTVTTTGLDRADYPLAIDPSVSIDSTTDFRTGNQEDNNSSIDSGSLSRSNISGGTVGSWTNNATNMPSSMYYHSSVAYNGYLYTIAGSAVRYAPISGDGSIGSWTSATSLAGGEYYADAVAYNGYLYVIGGGSTTPSNSVRAAKINSNGSLGSWQSTTSLPNGKSGHQVVAYNGYIYAIGGKEGMGGSPPSPQTFNYTGGQQTYTVPAGITSVSIDARGASGSPAVPGAIAAPGKGGRVQTTLSVTPGQTLYVYIGGQAETWGNVPGYNGGGIGGCMFVCAGGGGGASDVRQGGTSLGDRKIVAAGGGGGGGFDSDVNRGAGGDGGGTVGSNGTNDAYGGVGRGGGGTQSAGGVAGACYFGLACSPTAGSLGVGGNGGSMAEGEHGGGGGGGYYGGGGGGGYWGAGGGGGSSYAGAGTSSTVHTQGYQTGNGQVIITPETVSTTNNVYYAPINADGTVGAWNSTSSFANAREDHQAVAYNGYLYILGGKSGSMQYNDVQYARINSDGTVGSWAATASFTTARSLYSAVVSQGHIYILGGNTSNLNDVQYARINTDGTISAWNTTTAFNTGRYGHTSVAYNGYIYVIGGTGGSGVGDKIQYTSINPPGGLGNAQSTSSFTTGRYTHSTIVYKGYMYILGGSTTATWLNDVQYAPINSNGTLGSWSSTTSFTTARHYHSAVVANGYMYVIGGNGASGVVDDVQYAPINSNGTLGSWSSTTSFTTARYGHTSAIYNNRIYILGGYTGSARLNTVQYAPINSNGTLGSWSSTTSFTTARYAHTSVVANGYMYVIGGNGASGVVDDVQYAPINSNGTLGSWSSTTSFTTARYLHSSVVDGGYMYIIGGTTNGTSGLGTIQYAPINSNGTLGSWTATTGLATARFGLATVTHNGHIYNTGGIQSSPTVFNTTEFSQLNNGGGGGARGWVGGTSFANARYNHATVAHNGYLYIIGGFNQPSTYYADVQKAPILDSGGLGAWTSGGSDLPSARSGVAAIAHNGHMYVIGGKTAGGFLNEVQRASIDKATGTLGSWVADTSFSGARYATAAAVYNGYLYIMGGNNAGPQSTTFYFTGGQQTYTVPAGVTSVKVAAQGADGGGVGNMSYDVGGSGSYVEADLPVTPGETLYVEVGGNGATNEGYNGGGVSGADYYNYSYYYGGGASDVRQGGTGLANRKIVAGGGGGAGGSPSYYGAYGGGGGDLYAAEDGGSSGIGLCDPGIGATDVAGGLGGMVQPIGDTEQPGQAGVLGVGGDGGDQIGGGGGGGYYGGGGGGGWQVYAGCGGGGGSSYVDSGASNPVAYPGYGGSGSANDGEVTITHGKAAFNDVQFTKINSDGTLDAWSAASSMTQDRTQHAAVAVNGYLYAIGGTPGTGVHRTVEYAPINSNGTLGSWSYTASLSTPRLNVSAAVVNGYIYAIGGYSGSAYLSSVEYVPISSNGTLGSWQGTVGMGNIRSSEGKSATSYNGRLYATGGFNGVSVALNTTEYTSLDTIPRKTAYSKVIDLGTMSNVTGLSYSGNITGEVQLRYKVANTEGVFGAYKTAGQYSCSEGEAGRYVQVFATVDDEGNSVFKDADGVKSVLDSITVDYVPFVAPTEKRLRHGAFFQNETLQPFNTNNTQCSA